MIINDNFCGYLEIDNEPFSYSFSNQIVTLLPAQSDESKRREIVSRIASRTVETPEFIYGEDNQAQIAFLRTTPFSQSLTGFVPSLRFSPPLIVKANGNADGFFSHLSSYWNEFHAITFWGGNINAICDPQRALVPRKAIDYFTQDGVTEMKTRPWDDYTRTADFFLDGQKVSLTISVSQSGDCHDKTRKDAVVLGELNSFIQFVFEKKQDFSSIIKYYTIARDLVAILTKQNNVTFNFYLSQSNEKGQLYHSAICKAFDGYANYSVRNRYSVIPLDYFFDCLPSLLEQTAAKQYDALLSVLPDNNHNLDRITITNVQDLCTALEVSYEWDKRKRSKDALIEDLKKQIKKTIKCFMSCHSEIDVYKDSTISSSFSYLDYTLREKIDTLYQENQEIVDSLSKKLSLPYLSKDNISAFVKLRNGKTHSGIVEWGKSAEIYPLLFALEYICVLKNIGIRSETIHAIIIQRF